MKGLYITLGSAFLFVFLMQTLIFVQLEHNETKKAQQSACLVEHEPHTSFCEKYLNDMNNNIDHKGNLLEGNFIRSLRAN